MDVNQVTLFNAAMFNEATRRHSMTNLLTDGAPKRFNEAKASAQTSPGAPVVRITDLSKSAGDTVKVDLVHQLNGQPAMGDEQIAGYMESMTFAEDEMKINQGRKGVRSGGRMAQKRTAHNLVSLAKAQMMPWYSRFDDQTTLIHLAGARGTDASIDWLVPLASHPRFSKIMVNPVTPPTYDRHWFAGNATGIGDIDSADTFSVTTVENIRLRLDEMPFPLQQVRYGVDTAAEDDPLHVLLLTPRQFRDFSASAQSVGLNTMIANATKRASIFKHPLFMGECYLWKNILVKKNPRPVYFASGTSVPVCTNSADAATSTATAGVRVDRALLLGAQALGVAFGKTAQKNGLYFGIHTETTDHGAQKEHSVAWMNGKKKLRFRGTDGRINDLGVVCIDSAVTA